MYWPREESDIRLGKPKLQPCNDPRYDSKCYWGS
jgi:hypothetical protein